MNSNGNLARPDLSSWNGYFLWDVLSRKEGQISNEILVAVWRCVQMTISSSAPATQLPQQLPCGVSRRLNSLMQAWAERLLLLMQNCRWPSLFAFVMCFLSFTTAASTSYRCDTASMPQAVDGRLLEITSGGARMTSVMTCAVPLSSSFPKRA